MQVAGMTLVLLLAGACLPGCASRPTAAQLAAGPAPHASLPQADALIDGRSRFREIFCGILERRQMANEPSQACEDLLWKLEDERPGAGSVLPDPDRSLQIYLVPGAFSECLGDEAMPFRQAARALSEAGYRIATIMVSGRSGSEHNAEQIARRLSDPPVAEAGPAVLIGYSKGANDVLAFLADHAEAASRVVAVVSVAGAIGGSPLAESVEGVYAGVLGRVPSRRCRPGDGRVLSSLVPKVREQWLAQHPLPGSVRYFSIAAFTTRSQLSVGLVPTWQMLLRDDLRNDGQLLARDMLIPAATVLGYANADHWSVAIDVEVVHPVLGPGRNVAIFPRESLLEAILLQVGESIRLQERR